MTWQHSCPRGKHVGEIAVVEWHGLDEPGRRGQGDHQAVVHGGPAIHGVANDPHAAQAGNVAGDAARALYGDLERAGIERQGRCGYPIGLSYQEAGLDCAVCGPGSIEHAHKANEAVEVYQLAACLTMLSPLETSLR